MKRAYRVFALALVSLAASRAVAHPLSFGALRLTERAGGRVVSTFRYSGSERRVVGAEVVFPAHCASVGTPVVQAIREGVEVREVRDCGARGLAGASLTVRGLEGEGVQFRVEATLRDGRPVRALLDDRTRTVEIPAEGSADSVFTSYVWLGLEHIASGIDHLLFVLGLVVLVRGRRALLTTITAFTLGHSLTLALATLGVIAVPRAPVECAIALSILLVALELAHGAKQTSLTVRHPAAVAASFGLLHGLGFAGALAETGLPHGEVPLALLAFNVGVECGQLVFVAAALAFAGLAVRARVPERWRRRVLAALPYAIGAVASYWVIDRALVIVG